MNDFDYNEAADRILKLHLETGFPIDQIRIPVPHRISILDFATGYAVASQPLRTITLSDTLDALRLRMVALESGREVFEGGYDPNRKPAIKAPVTQERIDNMLQRSNPDTELAAILKKARRHL